MPAPTTATLNKKPKRFDMRALLSMSPPLVLRVERRGPSGSSPIPLPPGVEGAEPGAGFDIAGVQFIEKWILQECGGGLYDLSATDSQGAVMEWQVVFEPKLFPPKIPGEFLESASVEAQHATLQQAAQAAQAAAHAPQGQPAAPAPVQDVLVDPATGMPVALMPQMPATLPTLPTLPQVNMTQLRSSYAWPFPYPAATQIPQQPAANDARAEIRSLEQKLHEGEMKRIEEKNQDQLREQQRAFDSRLREIQDQLARTNNDRSQSGLETTMMKGFEAILTSIKSLVEANAKPAGPSAEMLAMQAQMAQIQEAARRAEDENRRLREQSEARERERIAQEAHRRDMEIVREQMRQSEERFNRLVDEMKSNANRGPDPVVQMMQENTRMMVDYMKSTAMAQDANMRQLAAQIMSPSDLMRLMKDSSNGADILTRNVAGAYNDMFGMFRTMSEHVMSMGSAGSEPPIVGVVKDAVTNVSAMADKWIGGQRDTSIAAAQVEKTKLELQRDLIRAQTQPPMPIVTAPPPNNGVQPSLPQPPPQAAQPATQVATTPTQAAQPAISPTTGVKRKGKTDIEWFTPVLLPHIEELRKGVAMFMDAVTAKPPKTDEQGQLLGVNPMQTVEGMLTVAAQIEQNKVDVPAFTQLFMQERYADLFDVVLPDAPQIYRDDCVQLMFARLNPQPGAVAAPQLPVVNTPPNGANGAHAAQPAPAVKVPANVQPADDDDVSDEDEEEVDEDGEPVEDAVQPTRPSGRRGGPPSSGTKKRVSA